MLRALCLVALLAGCQSMGAALPRCTQGCTVVVVIEEPTMSRGGNSPSTQATVPVLP